MENQEITVDKSERDLLKEKADLLGVSYANNISTDKLRELVNKANEPLEVSEPKQEKATSNTTSEVDPVAIRLELTKKVRVLITCNDPLMKDYDTTPYY